MTKAYGRTQYWPMPEFVGTLRREIIVTLSNLKLYQSSGSLNSRRVRIFLAEKGLKPTPISVDLGKGELRSDQYRLFDSSQMVPTLVLEDGTAIGGSGDLALPGGGPSDEAAFGRYPYGKSFDHHVGAARGTRRLCSGDGGCPQHRQTAMAEASLSDAQGKLFAHANTTCLILDVPDQSVIAKG